MALTDFADIYAALHDAGINRVIKHFMQQRPSLFNYGTENVRKNPSLLCAPINAAPGVTRFLTVLDPIPIIGVNNLGLDFCVQLTDIKFEFYPSNTITLPGELNPLPVQTFAIKLTACAGISCLPRSILNVIRPDAAVWGKIGTLRSAGRQMKRQTASGTGLQQDNSAVRQTALARSSSLVKNLDAQTMNPALVNAVLAGYTGILVIPSEKLECFCLIVFVTGTADITGTPPNQRLSLDIGKIEIADIAPAGMENSIECYLQLALERGIIPQVLPGISELLFSPLSLGTSGELTFSASVTAPHNPAVEDNQLKVHVNLDHIDLTLPEPGEEPPEPLPEPDTRYIRTRTRTDAFDLTTAVRETTLRSIFQIIGNKFTWSLYDGGSWGPLSVAYGIAVSVHDCSLELRSDHKMTVGFNIDVDTLYMNFGIDIPEISIPGFCLIPPAFPKDWCAVWIPGVSFFSANPDILLPFDISGILSADITFTAAPVVYYGEGTPDRWMLFVDPDPALTSLSIDGIADIPGTLLENAIDAAIESLGLPDWAEDVIEAILGPLVDLVKDILGIIGDIGLWIINFIGDTLGLWDLLKTVLLDYLGDTIPLFQLPDPVAILPADAPEIEVKLPISYLGAVVNDTELILQADIGGGV